MYKDYRYINAGENEIYRWGKKAIAKVEACLEPNDKGYYSIPADGGAYWTIGTSNGKYGEFAKFGDTFFSVNSYGFVYAKAGNEKGEKFVEMLQQMISDMKKINEERAARFNGEEEDVEEVVEEVEEEQEEEDTEEEEYQEVSEIEILISDGCTRSEAERTLKNGTTVFTDLEENLELYLKEWQFEEEDEEDIREMVRTKKPARDWGVVEKFGKTYFIEYCL